MKYFSLLMVFFLVILNFSFASQNVEMKKTNQNRFLQENNAKKNEIWFYFLT